MRISQCVDFIFAAAGNISHLHNDDVRQHRISTFYKISWRLYASTRLHSFRRGKLSEAATGMIAVCSKRSVALLISGPRIKSKQKLFEKAFTQSNI